MSRVVATGSSLEATYFEYYDQIAALAKERIHQAEAAPPDKQTPIPDLVEAKLFDFSVDDNTTTFAQLLGVTDRYQGNVAAQEKVIHAVGEIVNRLMPPNTQEHAREKVSQGVGMMIIRPEVLPVSNIITRLVQVDTEIIDVRRLELTPEQYVALYSHAFLDPKKEMHVRRRANGYIETPLDVVVMKAGRQIAADKSFMDEFTRIHKGTAGLRDGRTLRGGIVYDVLTQHLQADRRRLLDALDPLGLYEQPTWANTYAAGVDPLLANLPGVHVPDSTEVVKDMCVVLGDFTI